MQNGKLVQGGKGLPTDAGTHVPLILNWKGEIPEGYFVARTPTRGNWVVWRGFQVSGSTRPAVEATKAKEGATGWSDTWMVAKDTPNINCSYKWLDWIASPEVNAQVAEWFGEAPANAKSCELTSAPDHCDVYHAGDTEYWKDVYYWNTPTANCLDGRTDTQCVPYSEWATAWSALRS